MKLFMSISLLLAVAVTGYAHHSFAAHYFEEQSVTVQGELVEFEYKSPHAWVHVMVKDEADATQLYGALKRRVTKERGKPSYDFASAEYRNKMKSVGAKLDPVDTQVAFWNNGHSEAHASVAAPSGTRGWRVSLSYTAEGAADK